MAAVAGSRLGGWRAVVVAAYCLVRITRSGGSPAIGQGPWLSRRHLCSRWQPAGRVAFSAPAGTWPATGPGA